MSLKRIVSIALALAIAVPVGMGLPMRASAVEYEGTPIYESGKYYRALTQVVLTGDPRTDIVNVALSQVGYQEGGARSQISGEVYGGLNFTEYGDWYGAQDMWCAMFVSWCADVAQISTDVIPKHAYTPDGLRWFTKRGLAWSQEQVAAGEYEPRPGDLIYFRSGRNENPTNHVGVVVAYEGGRIYTVEGNVGSSVDGSNGGMVDTKSYPVTNTYIVAVCAPDYGSCGTSVSADAMADLRQAVRTAEGSDYGQVGTGAVALGIGRWQGSQARSLLETIRAADPAAFPAEVLADMDGADWASYIPSQERRDQIRDLLQSPAGRLAQDELMDRQLRDYLAEAQTKQIHDPDGQCLYALLRCLAGETVVDRVLAQIQGERTAQTIQAALGTSAYAYLGYVAQELV